MTQILNFDSRFIKSSEYLYLNIIISRTYLYIIYHDIKGVPVVSMYKFKVEPKLSVCGSTIFRVGTINRCNKNYMALTNGTLSIVRDTIEYGINDLVLRDEDYKSLMALVFKSKAIFEENRFYTTLEY